MLDRTFFLISVLMMLLPFKAAHAAASDTLNSFEFADMQKVYQECSNSMRSQFYDCGCVSVRHLDLVRKMERDLSRMDYDDFAKTKERERLRDSITRKSYDQCTNVTSVAMRSYNQCVEWAMLSRDDYADFCQCYALRYTDGFNATGNKPYYNDAETRSQAITSCSVNPMTAPIALPEQDIKTAPSPFRNGYE